MLCICSTQPRPVSSEQVPEHSPPSVVVTDSNIQTEILAEKREWYRVTSSNNLNHKAKIAFLRSVCFDSQKVRKAFDACNDSACIFS
jgi:hypothetical protein